MIEKIRHSDFSIYEIDRTLPVIDLNANHYSNMIEWDTLTQGQLCEPATTKKMSINELKKISEKDHIKKENLSHTHTVERGVKCVFSAVLYYYEHADQHSSILQGDKWNK